MGILLYSDRVSEDWIDDALREGVRGFVLKDGIDRHLIPALDALSDHRPYWNEAIDEELFTRMMGGPPLPPGYYPLNGPPPPGYDAPAAPGPAAPPADPAAAPADAPLAPLPPTP